MSLPLILPAQTRISSIIIQNISCVLDPLRSNYMLNPKFPSFTVHYSHVSTKPTRIHVITSQASSDPYARDLDKFSHTRRAPFRQREQIPIPWQRNARILRDGHREIIIIGIIWC